MWRETAHLRGDSLLNLETPNVYEQSDRLKQLGSVDDFSQFGIHSPTFRTTSTRALFPSPSFDLHSPSHFVPYQMRAHYSYPVSPLSELSLQSPTAKVPSSPYLPSPHEYPTYRTPHPADNTSEVDDSSGGMTYEMYMRQQQRFITRCHQSQKAEALSPTVVYDNPSLASSPSMPVSPSPDETKSINTPGCPLASPVERYTPTDSDCVMASSTETPKAKRKAKVSPDAKKILNQIIHHCTYRGCTKTYGRLSQLRAHERSHLGIRPYVCLWPLCGWKFARSDELTRHFR